jgi:hypothetical protein
LYAYQKKKKRKKEMTSVAKVSSYDGISIEGTRVSISRTHGRGGGGGGGRGGADIPESGILLETV